MTDLIPHLENYQQMTITHSPIRPRELELDLANSNHALVPATDQGQYFDSYRRFRQPIAYMICLAGHMNVSVFREGQPSMAADVHQTDCERISRRSSAPRSLPQLRTMPVHAGYLSQGLGRDT